MRLKDFVLRLRALLFRQRMDEELQEELAFHLEMQVRKNRCHERNPAEAERQARLQFGSVVTTTEECREVRGISYLEMLGKDVRFAFRMLRKSPGFTGVALLTLALGIGANTALFNIVYAVLLRPLPYPDPDRLVAIYSNYPVDGNASFSYPNFVDWQLDNRSFAHLAAYHPDDFTFTAAGEAQHVVGERLTAGFFDALGVKPILGRNFLPEEDRIGGPPVVLLSENFWRNRLGSQRTILGQSVTLNSTVYTVVGVIPADFSFSGKGFIAGDVYVPLGQSPGWPFQSRVFTMDIYGFGKLRPEVSLAQARADMDGVARRLAERYPDADKDSGIGLVPLKQDITGDTATLLYLLLGAVGFVLLIACANIANLLLARSAGRMREFAVRAALGATHGRCICQVLAESVLLSLMGGCLGLLLAAWATTGALGVVPNALPRAEEVALDTPVLLFTLGISIGAGILFGLAPAFRMGGQSLQEVFKEGGRGTSGARHRLQRVFIVSEVALALVLLAGAGLMVRTLIELESVNPGFNPRNTLTFSLTLPRTLAIQSAAALREHYRQITENLNALPDVEAASMIDSYLPMEGDDELAFWRDEDPKPASDSEMLMAYDIGVQPGYLRAMQIPLRQGRFFTEDDTTRSPLVVVVDEVFAQTFFPNQNPVGKVIDLTVFNAKAQIIGVVGHVKHAGLAADSTNSTHAQMYYACMQVPDRIVVTLWPLSHLARFLVRTKGHPLTALGSIREILNHMNNQQTIYGVATLDKIVSDSVAPHRFTMILMGAFAALALTLAGVGIYGVMSYVVGQRTQEIGLRIALGAHRMDVLRLVLGESATMAVLGVLIGTAAAFGLTRLLSKMLYGVSAHDPLTFAGGAILLTSVALVASYIPAQRAMRVDPMVALRHE